MLLPLCRGLLISLMLFCASKLMAQSEGFHYIPASPGFGALFHEQGSRLTEIGTVLLFLDEGVYRGSGDDSLMVGVGGVYRPRWQQSAFTILSPQYGIYFFFGDPNDRSGGRRQRFSLQAPLALHYSLQLMRDDSDRAQKRSLSLFGGLLSPLTFDWTDDGVTTSGDLGIQVGLAYAMPLRQLAFEVHAAFAQFLIGYFYIDDLQQQDFDTIEQQVSDLSAGLQWFYQPWQLSLVTDFHWTSGLADVDNNRIYGVTLHLVLHR